MVIHDFVDDDFVVERKTVRTARRRLRGIKPAPDRVRVSSPQGLFDDHGIQERATVWRVKEKFVAGLGTKAQFGLVERQVTRGRNRGVWRENEWIVRVAVADQNIAG